MFSTEDAPADGVSAVKAIALAAAEGQRIYTITADNVEQALAQINISAATEQEIRNAAYSGKIITTHQHQINFHGWIGEGYIIIDPTTGAGAYKIAGGGNGGFMPFHEFLFGWLIVSFIVIVSVALISLALLAAAYWSAAWIGIGFFSYLYGLMNAKNYEDFNRNNAVVAILFIFPFLRLAEVGTEVALMVWFVEAMSLFWGLI